MYKRGQFYLVAGIIIAGIILGIIVISNYAKKESYVRIEEIGKELEIESQKVLDYKTYSGQDKLSDFGEDYSSYIGADMEFYFITGDENNLDAYKYLNGYETQLSDPVIEEGKIIFTLEEETYEFNLNPGENFYFIIIQEIKGEKYVFTG